MADRERQSQREQAERVKLEDPSFRKGASEQVRKTMADPLPRARCPSPGSASSTAVSVPLRASPRVIYDGRTVPAYGFTAPYEWQGIAGKDNRVQWVDLPGTEVNLAAGECRCLLGDKTIAAQFTIPWELEDQQGTFVVRFDDDEGRRWELNQHMHLTRAADEGW